MLQADLYRDISRVTGETIATVKRLGFLVADPSETINDPDAELLGPHVIDWDEFQTQQEACNEDEFIDFATH
ncbi:hypothetical protein CA51_13210 [Rosistilla oblonga]|uniref:hypothetical protein n=1 Tax=Rosistilla oblonga TaxID=2527990 RepID=UPI00118D482B|nr:hypothetical protein [Rosistilla oblonga]QDV11457.1 hypothetical protein CA51_13210 [Rosistilla oblonga]